MTATHDPSARHVLPTDAPYLANLAALWASDPALAAAIEGLGDTHNYPLETSRAGEPTVAVPTPDGRRIHLHSRHRPLEEAARIIDPIDCRRSIFFHVFGFGLGYHVELLFDRSGEESILYVFEPDLRLLRTALTARNFSRLIESGRVTFIWKLDKPDLFIRLTPLSPMVSMGTVDVNHVPSVQRDPSFYDQNRAWLAEFASFCRTNINTLLLNGRRTLENIARNVGWYAASPCANRLKDSCKGRLAVIVSAGPSLRKNKHLLKQLSGRAVIIAVQTTLHPLLEMGIEPDFVTALDYHDICTRFFEKLPTGLRTELVAEPKATNLILGLHTGPVSITGNEMAESLLREMNLNRGGLRSGSTVAHLAYYLAEHLGCNPIAFVGQDLGFTDGLFYIPGTSYEDVWRPELGRFCTVEMKNWEQIVRERPIMRRIPDQQGRPMFTEERLFTYLQQFERDFGRTSTTILDATEGGAAKRGATPMPLAEVIAQHASDATPIATVEHPGMDWSRLEQCIGCLQNRRGEAAEVQRISRATLPLLEEIRDQIADQAQVNRLIARIDQLRAQMHELGRTYDLIVQLTQPTEMKRFEADRKIAAARLTGSERQREQVQRDVENVRAVIAAAGEFMGLMDEVIDQLGQQQTVHQAAALVAPATQTAEVLA
jgi:hypothetical protein